MEENQKFDSQLSQEEKLKASILEVNNLMEDLKSKQEEYDNISEELNNKKNEINSTLIEIDSSKQVFIDDINKKLEEYEDKFNKINIEITDFKQNTEETFKDFTNKFNEIIEKFSSDAESKLDEMSEKIDNMSELLNKENEDFDKFIKDNKEIYQQQYEKIQNLVSQYQASTTESLTSIKARLDEATDNSEKIKQIEARAKVFKENLDEYIENMTSTTEEINEKTKKYNDDTQEIIEINTKLTEEIKEQLQKATGVSLFHMFQKRKEKLEENQGWWLFGIILSIILLVCFSAWILISLPSVEQNRTIDWFKDAIFKFTLSTPVIYLLYFLTDRYTKLRRLIEEYAFKSAISLALTPYFELVKGLDKETEEKDKDFLIAVIGNIFKTPTDKVFKTKESQFDLDFSNYYKNIANVFIPNKDDDSTK